MSSHSGVVVPPSTSRIRRRIVRKSFRRFSVVTCHPVRAAFHRPGGLSASSQVPHSRLVRRGAPFEAASRPFRTDSRSFVPFTRHFGPFSRPLRHPDRPADRLGTVRRQRHFGPFPETDEGAAFRRSRAPASFRSQAIIPKLSITSVSFHHFAVILTPSRPSGAISQTRSHPSFRSHFLIPKSISSSQSVVPSTARRRSDVPFIVPPSGSQIDAIRAI